MSTTDPAYIEKYRQVAGLGVHLHGLSVIKHARQIRKCIKRLDCRTVLDYGCGRGDAYYPPHSLHRVLGVPRPTLYDPAFERHDRKPTGKFDCVICSDVLEHIPERDVDDVIAELFAFATKVVWSSVCCRPASKSFPDGENMHVTVKPIEWWREKFAAESARTDLPFLLQEAV